LQVLVSCRQRPNWNLPRLVLDDQLLEFNGCQLALTRAEFERLINRLGSNLDVVSRERLWAQCGGWCAGLRLQLAADADTGKLLRDYLQRNLIERLGEEQREVLYGLAHLPKVCPQLCDELWEGHNGAKLFDQLLSVQAFIVALDGHGRWYRLLPAVAEALRERLHGQGLSRLRLRYCRLMSAIGHFDEAIEQALRAGQPEVAATYMERLRLTWLLDDRHLNLFLTWREQVPAHVLESGPRLLYLCARALLFRGRLSESQAYLSRLHSFVPQHNPRRQRRLLGNWQALHGTHLAIRGAGEAGGRHCQEALSNLDEQDWLSQLLCQSTLARICMVQGHLAEAGQRLDQAVELARRNASLDSEMLLNLDRFRLMMLQGQVSLAEALLHKELRRLPEGVGGADPLRARLLFVHGELLLVQGRMSEASQVLQAGMQEAQDSNAPFIVHGYLLQAEVAMRHDHYEQVQLLLHEALRRLQCANVDSRWYQPGLTLQSLRMLARQAQWQQLLPQALALEAELGGHLAPLNLPSLLQRNQLLLGQAEYHTGAIEAGMSRLTALRRECQHLGFVLLAKEVGQVLDSLAPRASPAPKGQMPAYQDELTPREVSVLKLLAEGMSLQEVGDSLFISINTVKTHAKNINVKLGACRRTQAISCAKAMGILA